MPDHAEVPVQRERPNNRVGPQSHNVVVITGMHRSGTSVVAQALGRSGLFLGDDLKGPSRFNPEGYFEDLAFIRFHEDLLEANGAAWDAGDSLNALQIPHSYERKARDLVARKSSGRSVWGWKDPRSTLFLELWDRVLPEARWVFAARRPAEVVSSMLNRGDLKRFSVNPVRRALGALRLWVAYNRRIVEYVKANPDKTLLLLTPDDFDAASHQHIDRVVTHRWKTDLRPIDFKEVYIPGGMEKRIPRWIRGITHLYRPAGLLQKELEEVRRAARADGTEAQQIPRGTTRRPVVCVICPKEPAHSETFVRNHIRYLPGEIKVLKGGSRHLTGVTGLKYLDRMIFGGPFPNRSGDGRRLFSPVALGLDSLVRHLFLPRREPGRIRALRRHLRRERVEVVLAEFGHTGALVMSACRSAGVPLVVHFHGSDAYSKRYLDRYLASYRELFAVASAIVAVSQDMVEHLATLGAPRDKLVHNPCGADVEFFDGANPALAPPTLLAVGRFVEKKAPYLTLLAFKRVQESCPEARLVMMGDGELFDMCRDLSGALSLEHAVSFPGFRSQLEVVAAMREARNSEGTPVTILEAGAAGLPVVSTRHGGIKDVVVDGETGYLVEEGDIEAMARRMVTLIRSPDHAAALGQRARERVRAEFSMERSISRLSEILERSISGGSTRSTRTVQQEPPATDQSRRRGIE
jgi:glycosyltransferase involved in cell wall biosynthesis